MYLTSCASSCRKLVHNWYTTRVPPALLFMCACPALATGDTGKDAYFPFSRQRKAAAANRAPRPCTNIRRLHLLPEVDVNSSHDYLSSCGGLTTRHTSRLAHYQRRYTNFLVCTSMQQSLYITGDHRTLTIKAETKTKGDQLLFTTSIPIDTKNGGWGVNTTHALDTNCLCSRIPPPTPGTSRVAGV